MHDFTRKEFFVSVAALLSSGLAACGADADKGEGHPLSAASVDVASLDSAGVELANAEVRRAIGLLIDRPYLCASFLAGEKKPASSLVPQGLKGPDGTDFHDAGGLGDGRGYFDVSDEAMEDNYAQAIETLRKYYEFDDVTNKATNFPTFALTADSGVSSKSICEYLQAAFGVAGVRARIENVEFTNLVQSLGAGAFDAAMMGWVLDFDDPISILEIWRSTSPNDSAQLGKGAHADVRAYDIDLTDLGADLSVTGGTWAETYDALLDAIDAESDDEVRIEMMHRAEDMVMATGAVCPLCSQAATYLLDRDVKGFYATPLGMKCFEECTIDGGGDTLNVCYSAEPSSLDPALTSSGPDINTIDQLNSGLARWGSDEDGTEGVVPELAEELVRGETGEDGSVTYTYTLRDGLTWSDGTPLTAGDFVFAWKRAASPQTGADYGYLFEIIKGYPNDLAVSAPDDRTFEVTTKRRLAYWEQLLAMPAFFPVREDVVADENWANEAATYVSSGPFRLASWQHNGTLTMERRDDYWDRERVTMPRVVAYLEDDLNTMLTNWEAGDWQFINGFPAQEAARLQRQYPDEVIVAPYAGTSFITFNVNHSLLPK